MDSKCTRTCRRFFRIDSPERAIHVRLVIQNWQRLAGSLWMSDFRGKLLTTCQTEAPCRAALSKGTNRSCRSSASRNRFRKTVLARLWAHGCPSVQVLQVLSHKNLGLCVIQCPLSAVAWKSHFYPFLHTRLQDKKKKDFQSSQSIPWVCLTNIYMGVSKARGKPPKSSILIGFSIINHPFWGTPIFGNTHITSFKQI